MPRENVEHILDSFTALAATEQEQHGEFKSKRLVLEQFDSMGAAIRGGGTYRSLLDPPPGDPRAAHQPRVENCPRCGKFKACCGETCHGCRGGA